MRKTWACEAAFKKGVQDALDGIEMKEEPSLTPQAIEIHNYELMGRYIGDKVPLNLEFMVWLEQKCRENDEQYKADLYYNVAIVQDEIWSHMKKAAGKPGRKNLGTAAGQYAISQMEQSARLSCTHRAECAKEFANLSHAAAQVAFVTPGSLSGVQAAQNQLRRSETPKATLRGTIRR